MNGREYMARVADLTCAICKFTGVEVHHLRAGTGGGRRASDFDTIPLCPEHHRGPKGIHGLGTKGFPAFYGVTEENLIAETREILGFKPEEIEVWKQADRDRRRKVSKPKGSKKAPDAIAGRSRWPSRKLTSGSSFRTR